MQYRIERSKSFAVLDLQLSMIASVSGLRSTSLDPDLQNIRAAEEVIQKLLREKVLAGEAGRFESFFARGKKGSKDEEVLELLAPSLPSKMIGRVTKDPPLSGACTDTKPSMRIV